MVKQAAMGTQRTKAATAATLKDQAPRRKFKRQTLFSITSVVCLERAYLPVCVAPPTPGVPPHSVPAPPSSSRRRRDRSRSGSIRRARARGALSDRGANIHLGRRRRRTLGTRFHLPERFWRCRAALRRFSRLGGGPRWRRWGRGAPVPLRGARPGGFLASARRSYCASGPSRRSAKGASSAPSSSSSETFGPCAFRR